MSSGFYMEARDKVTIYRCYDNENSRRFGSYWAFEPPEGSHDEYRRAYAMCREWNVMTFCTACTLPKGALVFIGPGQSMDCRGPSGRYRMRESDVLQIYVPNADRVCQ